MPLELALSLFIDFLEANPTAGSPEVNAFFTTTFRFTDPQTANFLAAFGQILTDSGVVPSGTLADLQILLTNIGGGRFKNLTTLITLKLRETSAVLTEVLQIRSWFIGVTKQQLAVDIAAVQTFLAVQTDLAVIDALTAGLGVMTRRLDDLNRSRIG